LATWITANAEDIVKTFFGFFDWVTTNAAKVVTMVTPAAIKMMVAITDAMVAQAPDLIEKLSAWYIWQPSNRTLAPGLKSVSL
jgi:hypothetical protein